MTSNLSERSNRMQITEETCLSALTHQTILAPAMQLTRAEMSQNGIPLNPQTRKALEDALHKCESISPGFMHEFVKDVAKTAQLDLDMQETYLRLHATAPTDDLELPSDKREFVELSARAIALKRVLARVPDEMSDRRTFLETIKEIASSIKKLLEAVNEVHAVVPPEAQSSVERRKKEFVHYSKRFSNTLKEYFKGEDAKQVYISANQLIFYTTFIVRTVREKTRVRQR